jgi:hypothetical protein
MHRIGQSEILKAPETKLLHRTGQSEILKSPESDLLARTSQSKRIYRHWIQS